jgi:hypothetical protein
MTATLAHIITLRDSRFVQFFRAAYSGSKTLSIHAAVMLLCFVLCLLLQVLDARTFNGASVWMKPGKFFFSTVVHFLTIAWAMSLANKNELQKPAVRWSVLALLTAAWYELIYISFRAANAEASHFNVSTVWNSILYNLMALGAVALVVSAAVIGVVMWRSKPRELWTQSVAIGFTLGAILTLIVGMTLGGNSGHWIGGDLTDATGLPILKWSTTGGDLRVSHFLGLHAMQLVPLAALSGRRSVVYGAAMMLTVLTAFTFAQALMGVPLLRM